MNQGSNCCVPAWCCCSSEGHPLTLKSEIERPCSVPTRWVERRLTQDVLEQTSAARNQPSTRCRPLRRACPNPVFPPTHGFHPRTAGQGRPWAKRYRPPRRAEMPRQPIKGLAMGPWHEREQLRKARGSGRNQLAHGDNHGIRSPRGVSPSPPWRATFKVRLGIQVEEYSVEAVDLNVTSAGGAIIVL